MKIRKKQSLSKEIRSELKMTFNYIKGNIFSAAELRFSFVMQVVGMMLNNSAFLLIWIFFFQAFGEINGWTGKEVIALQGFLAITYGITFSLFSGVSELPTAIHNGAFDSILLTPRNLYLRILTLVTRTSAIGDILSGVVSLVVYFVIAQLSIFQILMLLLLLVPSTIVLTNFALICSCISFFIPDADELSKNVFEIMFGPSLYPSGVYQGATRVFFLFILPTMAIAGLPVEAVKYLDVPKILFVWGLAIVWTLIALFVLKQGIKRYESGNLTGARI